MVLNLIRAPDFFYPQEIWVPRNLGLKNFGPPEIWAQRNLSPNENHYMAFSCGAQTSQGPNFLPLGAQISWGPKNSGAKIRSWTISVKVQVF